MASKLCRSYASTAMRGFYEVGRNSANRAFFLYTFERNSIHAKELRFSRVSVWPGGSRRFCLARVGARKSLERA